LIIHIITINKLFFYFKFIIVSILRLKIRWIFILSLILIISYLLSWININLRFYICWFKNNICSIQIQSDLTNFSFIFVLPNLYLRWILLTILKRFIWGVRINCLILIKILEIVIVPTLRNYSFSDSPQSSSRKK
jgi:hypothetical protein